MPLSEGLKELGASAEAGVERAVHSLQNGVDKAKQIIAHAASKANHKTHDDVVTFRATPTFANIGAEYDSTFMQRMLRSKRFVFSTPNLWPVHANSRGRTALRLASIHDTNECSEQVTSNFLWSDSFGLPEPGNPGWKHPLGVTATLYTATPIHPVNSATVDTVANTTLEFQCLKSGRRVGIGTRVTASSVVHSAKVFTRFGSATADWKHVFGAKLSQLTGSLSTTLYHDRAREDVVWAGV